MEAFTAWSSSIPPAESLEPVYEQSLLQKDPQHSSDPEKHCNGCSFHKVQKN
ncbi:hypothetical protein EMIT036CA2_50236 [Chryseobacterium sp. IT-36CA2]